VLNGAERQYLITIETKMTFASALWRSLQRIFCITKSFVKKPVGLTKGVVTIFDEARTKVGFLSCASGSTKLP
jgi:hypothetical protein